MTTPARYAVFAPVHPDLDALRLAAELAEREAGALAMASFRRETPEALRAYAEAEDRAAQAHAAYAAVMPRRTARERQRADVVATKAVAGPAFAARAREAAVGLEAWS